MDGSIPHPIWFGSRSLNVGLRPDPRKRQNSVGRLTRALREWRRPTLTYLTWSDI